MTYTIAEVAERTGLSAHTLRYYERDDLLLKAPARDGVGRRTYEDDDLTWIQMVTCLRATGMPIREVRRYAELVRTGGRTEVERLSLLEEHRDAVRAEMAEAAAHLSAIEAKIELYRKATAAKA